MPRTKRISRSWRLPRNWQSLQKTRKSTCERFTRFWTTKGTANCFSAKINRKWRSYWVIVGWYGFLIKWLIGLCLPFQDLTVWYRKLSEMLLFNKNLNQNLAGFVIFLTENLLVMSATCHMHYALRLFGFHNWVFWLVTWTRVCDEDMHGTLKWDILSLKSPLPSGDSHFTWD